MAIDGGLRGSLAAGTQLVARYKGTEYTATVEQGEDGKAVFRLGDGRAFKSPSSAGSAVMGGTACNGWRFWSLAGAEPRAKAPRQPKAATTPAKRTRTAGAAKPKPASKPKAAAAKQPARRASKAATRPARAKRAGKATVA